MRSVGSHERRIIAWDLLRGGEEPLKTDAVGWPLWYLHAEGERGIGAEAEFVDLEPNGADRWVPDGDGARDRAADVVGGPPLSKLCAVFVEGCNELGEASIACVLAVGTAKLPQQKTTSISPTRHYPANLKVT